MYLIMQKSKLLSDGLLYLFSTFLLTFVGNKLYASENLSSNPAIMQQVRAVTGVVTDTNGETVIGVSVVVKGTSNGTMTNTRGEYTIQVGGQNPVLSFSCIGYKTQEVPADRNVINIILELDQQQIQEVVVVGYGVQKKENLTGAVSTIDVSKAIDSKPLIDIQKALQGITPGLTITYKNGNLGAGPTMRLRGAGTIIDGVASGSPMILVDGVETDLSFVNPEDVANISVLKDAAASSIYGARAAFGVILITTKSGKSSEKVTFSYSNNFAYSKPSILTEFADPLDELPVMIDAGLRSNGQIGESFGMFHDKLLTGIKRWKENYASSRNSKNKEMIYGEDWEIIDGRAYTYRVWEPHKEMLRDWTPQMNHNLSAQGNFGEKSNFLISLGYTEQSGFMRINTDKLKRYNANFNLTTQLASWLTSNVGYMFSRKNHKEPFNYYNAGSGTNVSEYNGYFGYYMRWGKYFPYGTYDGYYFRHAPGYMSQANLNDNTQDFMRLSADLTARITKDLTFKVEYRFTTENNDLHINGHPIEVLDFWSGGWDPNNIIGTALSQVGTGGGSTSDKIAHSNSKRENHLFNAYATYTKSFDDSHNLKVMGGTNIEKNDFQRTYSERRGVMDPSMTDINLTTGDQFVTSSWNMLKPTHTQYAIAGFFARVNYDYMGKYLLELNGRYDGSSSFPQHQLWGFFPSASVGYRISEESFMEPIKSVINDLKIRGSIGSIGNQKVKDNAFRSMMNTASANWILGSALAPTVGTPGIVDSDISWETILTYDVGLDVRFLNNIFGLTADWYQRYNKDMLAIGMEIPKAVGTDAPFTNAGEMKTTGYELSLDANIPINKNINLYAVATLSDYQTEITKWDNPNKTLGALYEGMKLGEIWGFETDRLFQEGDFTKDASGKYVLNSGIASQAGLISGNFTYGPGDIKYKDLDKSGTIDAGELTVNNPGDLKVIGNTTPRYEYSFRIGGTFYGFDADVFFQGIGKRDYWANSDLILPLYNRTDALYAQQLDFWSEDNLNAYFPRPAIGHATNIIGRGVNGSNNFITQSRYLLDMSYLRLKNVTIGYTLPQPLTKRIGLNKVRVYFSGQNLAEFKSDRLPVDPEINEIEAAWGRTYPYPRTYSMGLQLNF